MSRLNSYERPDLTKCVVARKRQNGSTLLDNAENINRDLDFLHDGDVLECVTPSTNRLGSGTNFEICRDEFNLPRDCQLGKIYKAWNICCKEDKDDRRLWAVKAIKLRMITPKAADDPMREIRIMQHLTKCPPSADHPSDKNYVLYEIFAYTDDQALYMIMPYCQEDMLCKLMRCHHFSESQAKRYFRQLLCGIRFLHRAKVSHRDLSLENLMLRKNSVGEHCTVVIDFGQALIDPRPGQPHGRAGKLYCMAPEVFWQHRKFNGPAADLWCCGICLYVMLLGHYPFGPGGAVANIPLMHLVCLEELLKMYKKEGRCVPKITSLAVDVMQSCLQFSPSKRPCGNESGHPVNGADALLEHKWFNSKQLVPRMTRHLFSSTHPSEVFQKK